MEAFRFQWLVSIFIPSPSSRHVCVDRLEVYSSVELEVCCLFLSPRFPSRVRVDNCSGRETGTGDNSPETVDSIHLVGSTPSFFTSYRSTEECHKSFLRLFLFFPNLVSVWSISNRFTNCVDLRGELPLRSFQRNGTKSMYSVRYEGAPKL